MEQPALNLGELSATSKQLARRILTIGNNRLELLGVEVEETRDSLMQVVLLALGIATFGLLAGISLSAAIAVLLWPYSPLGVLLALALLHGSVGIWLFRRLTRRLRDWQLLPATLDQLRKDRECLEKSLE